MVIATIEEQIQEIMKLLEEGKLQAAEIEVGFTYRVNPNGKYVMDNGRGFPIRCDKIKTEDKVT